MRIGSMIYPALLALLGGFMLLLDLFTQRNIWVELGAATTLMAGIIALLVQREIIGRKAGLIIGSVCAIGAIILAIRNYHAVSNGPAARSTESVGHRSGLLASLTHDPSHT
jgi:hypothetical protein